MTSLTKEQICDVMTVQDGRIVWKARSPDFYAKHFARAYDPDSASVTWNNNKAGKCPTWVMSIVAKDYTCNAMLQRVALRDVCEALGAPYDAMRAAVVTEVVRKSEDAARVAVLRAVEWDGLQYVWKVRTTVTHPNSAPADLLAFNTRYAGKKLTPRKGLYKISYRTVTAAQMSAWLKRGPKP